MGITYVVTYFQEVCYKHIYTGEVQAYPIDFNRCYLSGRQSWQYSIRHCTAQPSTYHSMRQNAAWGTSRVGGDDRGDDRPAALFHVVWRRECHRPLSV